MSDIVTVLDRIVIVTAANAVVVVAIVVACCRRRCCLCCDISAASFVILVLHCRHSRPICNRRKTAANPESKPIRQKPEYWLLLLPHGNIQERDIPATAWKKQAGNVVSLVGFFFFKLICRSQMSSHCGMIFFPFLLCYHFSLFFGPCFIALFLLLSFFYAVWFCLYPISMDWLGRSGKRRKRLSVLIVVDRLVRSGHRCQWCNCVLSVILFL